MIFLSNKVIPVDQLTAPSEMKLEDVIDKAKSNPIQATFELGALAMIAVGLYHSLGPVYAFFKSLGEALVYTA